MRSKKRSFRGSKKGFAPKRGGKRRKTKRFRGVGNARGGIRM